MSYLLIAKSSTADGTRDEWLTTLAGDAAGGSVPGLVNGIKTDVASSSFADPAAFADAQAAAIDLDLLGSDDDAGSVAEETAADGTLLANLIDDVDDIFTSLTTTRGLTAAFSGSDIGDRTLSLEVATWNFIKNVEIFIADVDLNGLDRLEISNVVDARVKIGDDDATAGPPQDRNGAGDGPGSFEVAIRNAKRGELDATEADAGIDFDLVVTSNSTIWQNSFLAELSGEDDRMIVDHDDEADLGAFQNRTDSGANTLVTARLGAGDDDFDATGLDGQNSTRDDVAGEQGDDTIITGRGDDTLDGGAGDDFLNGDVPGTGPAEPIPFVTTTAFGTIPQTGQQVTLTLSLPDAAAGETVTARGTIELGTVTAGDPTNIAYVIDVSGSMSSSFVGNEMVGDANGDGFSNELIDGAILAFQALNQAVIDAGVGNANVTVIPFNSGAPASFFGSFLGQANDDLDGDGTTDVDAFLSTLVPFGGTSFPSALQAAIAFFENDAPAGNNQVFFLSDGFGGTNISQEVETLIAEDGINATIRAIGLGSGADIDTLDFLDDTIENGSAERVLEPSQLTTSLTGGGVSPADIAEVEILVNGTVVETVDPSGLTATPFGLSYEVDLSGLDGAAPEDIAARAVFNDPDATALETAQTVEAAPASGPGAEGGDDLLTGGEGNDVFDIVGGNDTITDLELAVDETGDGDTLLFDFDGLGRTVATVDALLDIVSLLQSDGEEETDAILDDVENGLVFVLDREGPDAAITRSITFSDASFDGLVAESDLTDRGVGSAGDPGSSLVFA